MNTFENTHNLAGVHTCQGDSPGICRRETGDIASLSAANARRVALTGVDARQIMRILESVQNETPAQIYSNKAKPNDEPDIPGANIRDFQIEDGTVSFLFQGNIKKLMDKLTPIAYTDITVTEPDLNEIFMHFYE